MENGTDDNGEYDKRKFDTDAMKWHEKYNVLLYFFFSVSAEKELCEHGFRKGIKYLFYWECASAPKPAPSK